MYGIFRRATTLVLGITTVTTVAATAQNGSLRVTVPSPTAASLGKFGDVPVSLHTGVPEVSIPLFVAKGRTLELPIVLKYHSAGVKVEEIGGWAGIGWTLEAGGAITRTVRGLVDEGPGGFYHTGHIFWTGTNWSNPSVSFLQQLANGTYDGDPDQYFFSFAGRAGEIVLGPTSSSTTLKEVRTIPYQKLKINPVLSGSINSWTIVAEDGVKYTFGAVETTTDKTSPTGGIVPGHFNEVHTRPGT